MQNKKNLIRLKQEHFKIIENWDTFYIVKAEAVVCRCSSKQVFLKILQISHEKTCVGVSF